MLWKWFIRILEAEVFHTLTQLLEIAGRDFLDIAVRVNYVHLEMNSVSITEQSANTSGNLTLQPCSPSVDLIAVINANS
jgi:hypothetical protein